MNYLITGASSGIGKSIFDSLYSENNNYLLFGNKNISNKKLKNIHQYKINLKNYKKLVDPINKFNNLFGSFDNIIISAGTAGQLINFENLDFENFEEVLKVNYLSNIFILKYLWKFMKSKKITNIIIISSNTIKFTGSEKNFSYYFSKSILESQSLYLAKIGAKYKINVNMIRPGVVDTKMYKNVINYSKQKLNKRISKIPRKTMITKNEINSLVKYLCSPDAKSISGNIFTISGGE